MKISRCIAAALLVASTTTGCSSCVKDDAAPAQASPSDTASGPVGDRKAAPLPRGFERKPPSGIENVNRAVLVDGGADDATTN